MHSRYLIRLLWCHILEFQATMCAGPHSNRTGMHAGGERCDGMLAGHSDVMTGWIDSRCCTSETWNLPVTAALWVDPTSKKSGLCDTAMSQTHLCSHSSLKWADHQHA